MPIFIISLFVFEQIRVCYDILTCISPN